MTDPTRPADRLPPDPRAPDPLAYDSPRAERARAKGLPGPYISGGTDPDPSVGRAEERRFGRLLVAMIVVIVGSGFIVGTILALLGPVGGR